MALTPLEIEPAFGTGPQERFSAHVLRVEPAGLCLGRKRSERCVPVCFGTVQAVNCSSLGTSSELISIKAEQRRLCSEREGGEAGKVAV